jgi:ribonuclease D
MQTNSNYIIIDNKKGMELLTVNLGSSEILSIDTESSGYFSYYSKVCLIQISTKGKNYIIDPLSKVDLDLLKPIFKNQKILKIFHSATDDIKALKRDFGFDFNHIADTLYSSKLLNLEHNSLNYLVEYYHNVKLSKTEQKSNWEKRPLDKQQLQYAALDTAYLESIWEKMKLELEKSNLIDEATSEFKKITEDIYKTKESTHEVFWYKFPNILKFTPEQRRNIYDILVYRDEKAKKANKAPFRIFNNDFIIKIIKPEFRSEEKIAEVLGKKEAQTIFNILSNPSGPPLNKSDIPKFDSDTTEEEDLKLKNLHKWREKIMKHRGVDHSMILSNKQMIHLIRNEPKSLDDLTNSGFLSEWKVQNYGKSLLKALNDEPYDNLIKELIPITNQK